ncbi:hypothetical protein HA402_010709 [Bradysia odoriphaga]|nr:hypothetical protein HA402_010709 [Bradysia odoriphaga]
MKHLIYCGMLIVQYLVLFVDVNSADGGPTTNNVIARQCMQDGGYCQNSWDCCSNRCLSFSYKCVKGPPTSAYQPYAPSIIEDPTVISVDTLDDLVNRFGSDDEKTLAKPTTTSPVSSTSTSTSSSTIHTDECIGIGYECGESSQCCSNECLHYLDVHICIEKRTPTTATTTTVSPNGQCLLIGQKCYRHDECCTKRCHGFLHQCVT